MSCCPYAVLREHQRHLAVVVELCEARRHPVCDAWCARAAARDCGSHRDRKLILAKAGRARQMSSNSGAPSIRVEKQRAQTDAAVPVLGKICRGAVARRFEAVRPAGRSPATRETPAAPAAMRPAPPRSVAWPPRPRRRVECRMSGIVSTGGFRRIGQKVRRLAHTAGSRPRLEWHLERGRCRPIDRAFLSRSRAVHGEPARTLTKATG
jgi:hypothetical protein